MLVPVLQRYIILAFAIVISVPVLYFQGSRLSVSRVVTARLEPTYKPTAFSSIKDSLLNQPLDDGDFSELGRRVKLLTDYTSKADRIVSSTEHESEAGLAIEVEEFALSMFPWLRTASSTNTNPLRSLRESFVPNSRGIVIPAGKEQFRFAAHLISAIRDVLGSTLPIQVAFAGDEDLPDIYRKALLSLGSDIETLDINSVFDEQLIQANGSWAIKPFAMLASKFEQLILLDADSVLLQDPSIVFTYPGYKETGTFLFHDRLLWQHIFPFRQEWWALQMQGHSSTKAFLKSKAYADGYSEEQDSGMVVMDKRRLDIVTALLHICWQNTPSVREGYTYVLTYGDKESWWFGLELCGVEYTFEETYGSIAGEKVGDKVCAFTIAHPDPNNMSKLLWYNGSLLRNKVVNANEYTIPAHWATDGTWWKSLYGGDMSCMVDTEIRDIVPEQIQVLQKSIDVARGVDEKFKSLIQSYSIALMP